ncbi:MAG: transglycosylase SLT domain-containing protein [Oligoflexia bacterium]|nr:transglycosylase SLT domain-containing protein [Oligoflexia bacterium]
MKTMSKIQLCFLLILGFINPASGNGDSWLKVARDVASQSQAEGAIKVLQKRFNEEQNPQMKSRLAFALGTLALRADNLDLATSSFETALSLKTKLEDFAHYNLGLVAKKRGDYQKAIQHFQFVRDFRLNGNAKLMSTQKNTATLELARVLRAQGKHALAMSNLVNLEAAFRRTLNELIVPEILYEAYQIAQEMASSTTACRYALKIYTRYSEFGVEKGWGYDGPPVTIKGKTTQCAILESQREKHFDDLKLEGEFEALRRELATWEDRIKEKRTSAEWGRLQIEKGQLAQVEGRLSEAIHHYQAAQDILGKSLNLQLGLSRAYAQSDNYAAAVEGYMSAYQMSPGSATGQRALFQAAFLSYQNRDYDGAARRFEEFIKRVGGRHPARSRKRRPSSTKSPRALTWDAKWHLAWMRYLKQDFEGAIKNLNELSKSSYFDNPYDQARFNYWKAMSELRLGQVENARPIFTKLARDSGRGYYSAIAAARLSQLPPEPPKPELRAPPEPTPSGPTIKAPSDKQTQSTLPANDLMLVQVSRAPATEEDGLGGGERDRNEPPRQEESESSGAEKTAESGEEPEAQDAAAGGEEVAEVGVIETSPFKEPALLVRFERAQELLDLGFQSFARLELRQLEKSRLHSSYLLKLVEYYQKAGEYHRAADIAFNFFRGTRESQAMDGNSLLWTAAFPQAYASSVIRYSDQVGISPQFTWSIMRAESGFRENIHSFAGAIGLMQIIPPTARRVAESIKLGSFRKEMLTDPDTNIRIGTWYLKKLDRMVGGNLALVAASYNAGPHRVQGWLKDFGGIDLDEFIEHIPFIETRGYVKKVLGNYNIYQHIYKKESTSLHFVTKATTRFDGPKPHFETWNP